MAVWRCRDEVASHLDDCHVAVDERLHECLRVRVGVDVAQFGEHGQRPTRCFLELLALPTGEAAQRQQAFVALVGRCGRAAVQQRSHLLRRVGRPDFEIVLVERIERLFFAREHRWRQLLQQNRQHRPGQLPLLGSLQRQRRWSGDGSAHTWHRHRHRCRCRCRCRNGRCCGDGSRPGWHRRWSSVCLLWQRRRRRRLGLRRRLGALRRHGARLRRRLRAHWRGSALCRRRRRCCCSRIGLRRRWLSLWQRRLSLWQRWRSCSARQRRRPCSHRRRSTSGR